MVRNAAPMRPYGTACATCRRKKIRCVNTGLEPNRCDYCAKVDVACAIETPRRNVRSDGPSPATAETTQEPHQVAPDPGDVSRTGDSLISQPEPQMDSDASIILGRPTPDAGPTMPEVDRSPSFSPPSFVTLTEDTRTLSLDVALDPNRNLDKPGREKTVDPNPEREGPLGQDDPIHLRILNRPSAQHLFEGYFAHFDYNAGSERERFKRVSGETGHEFGCISAALTGHRPLVSRTHLPNMVSRDWLQPGNNWTYGFGDVRAVARVELSAIAKPVHDRIMSSHKYQSYTLEDIQSFTKAMNKFNTEMNAWTKYWAPAFASLESSIKSLEPQVYLYYHHIRTYFNAALLLRILASSISENDPTVTSTIQTCYSAAIGALQETIKLGKMDILYYLWDTAHLMIGYSAIILLRILKQGSDYPGVSRHTKF
ncbi:hypothetical protein TrVFT333_002464 [Trichoderma virens FT-333]|nr:hypothetical protein TrVFT333_002464 [Trichoderma virens FT-333]